MSIQVIAKVLRKRWGSTSRKIVAIKLADVAHDDGTRIFPSVTTVAAEAELSERQVQRILDEFKNEGLLILVKQGGGRNRTNEYRIDLAAIESLPDAKKKYNSAQHANADILSLYSDPSGSTESQFSGENSVSGPSFFPERVTCVAEKGDTVSPNPSLSVDLPSSKEASASGEASAKEPSLTKRIWNEGKELLAASSTNPNVSIIGKWLKRTPTNPAKEKLLAMFRAAAKAGTLDPVAYVTAALNSEFPAALDPKSFDETTWSRNVQAAITTKAWAAEWGPPPGKHGCHLPVNLVSAELISALAEGRVRI